MTGGTNLGMISARSAKNTPNEAIFNFSLNSKLFNFNFLQAAKSHFPTRVSEKKFKLTGSLKKSERWDFPESPR